MFKRIDLYGQLALIIGFIIAQIIHGDGIFMIGYIVVGGWQVLSMLIHFSKHWFTGKGTERGLYHWVTLTTVLLMPTLVIFWLLLFLAPFMALYYCWLCYDELYRKMKRPLAQLK
jgi:hypothetical protein